MSDPPTGGQPRHYAIRLTGHLEPRWATWFGGMTLVAQADGTTVLHGPVTDQAALHGLLQKVRDTGLPLLSVVEAGSDAPDVRTTELRSPATHEGEPT